MKLYRAVPIKRKTKIYISIIAVTFLVIVGIDYLKHRQSLSQLRKNSGYLNEKTLSSQFLMPIETLYLKKVKGKANFAIFLNNDREHEVDFSFLKNLNYFSAFIAYSNSECEADLNYLNSNTHIKMGLVYGIDHSTGILNISNQSLELLQISYSNIKKIYFSEGLNLHYLDLSRNDIQGIYGLENLKKLKVLKLSEMYITNLSALESCQDLEELNILGCTVEDFSPLTKLPKLQNLTVTLYDDFSFLKDMRSLRELNFKICSPIIEIDETVDAFNKMVSMLNKIDEIAKSLPNCKVTCIPFQW